MTEKDKIPNTCSFVESREANVTEAEIAALSDTLPENLLLNSNKKAKNNLSNNTSSVSYRVKNNHETPNSKEKETWPRQKYYPTQNLQSAFSR